MNPSWGGSERVGSHFLFDVSNLEADGSVAKRGTVSNLHAEGQEGK